MTAIGEPWGKQYTLLTPDGEQLTLTGFDYGMNVKTPESQVGWDLAHVEATDDPNVIRVAGRLFRAVPGQ